MYVHQSGFYPACTLLNRGETRWALWPARIRVYMGGETGVFFCPAQDERCVWKTWDSPPAGGQARPLDFAAAEHTSFGYELGEPMLDNWTRWFSYGYNVWGAVGTTIPCPYDGHRGLGAYVDVAPTNPVRELRASRVKSAADVIAVTDATADGWWDVAAWPIAGEEQVFPGPVHSGGANVLFCDGHVAWHPQVDLLVTGTRAPSQARIRAMWNNDHEPHWGE